MVDIHDRVVVAMLYFAAQLAELDDYDIRLNWLKHFMDHLGLEYGKEFLGDLFQFIEAEWKEI